MPDRAHRVQVFLSTQPAGQDARRLAFAVVLASAVVFLAALPFAKVPLAQVWAFIPIYESAIVINDLITAVLLLGQFRIVRSRALLLLASGYLFTALMAVAHALTFPGLFSANGLLGAGPQSTAWLYMFWHGGFPLVVIGYALLRDKNHDALESIDVRVAKSVLVVTVVVGACTLLATSGQDLLPAIMDGNRYTPSMVAIVSSVWLLSVLAIIVLWRRQPHSVLDLWLMVVMCAWLFDIALAAVFNAGRFDLGFYAGRVYGLAAASFVLLVLLLENGVLHARLAEAHKNAIDANRELKETQGWLVQSAKMVALGKLVAGVAHEINNPLAFVMSHLSTVERSLRDVAEEAAARLSDEGRRKQQKAFDRITDMHMGLERIRDLVLKLRTFSRLDEGERKTVPIEESIESILTLLQYRLKDRIEVIRNYGEAKLISCYPGPLNQVLMNVLANAADAIEGRGQITISTGKDGSLFFISVADNGRGMAPEVRERIFEPFFTTKPVGEGTGLGLSISYAIVRQHGGAVEVRSQPGKGTEMLIRIPLEPGTTAIAGKEMNRWAA